MHNTAVNRSSQFNEVFSQNSKNFEKNEVNNTK